VGLLKRVIEEPGAARGDGGSEQAELGLRGEHNKTAAADAGPHGQVRPELQEVRFGIRKNDMEDSYENALKESMESMRVGFLTQIANFQEEIKEINKKKVDC